MPMHWPMPWPNQELAGMDLASAGKPGPLLFGGKNFDITEDVEIPPTWGSTMMGRKHVVITEDVADAGDNAPEQPEVPLQTVAAETTNLRNSSKAKSIPVRGKITLLLKMFTFVLPCPPAPRISMLPVR